MHCCGSPYQEITVQAGNGALALLRCTSCGDQQWVREGLLLARDEAFDLLADAYREVPLEARAARDRAAPLTAARRAARMAQREAAQNRALTGPRGRADGDRVLTLPDGWQVLGATA